MPIASILTFYQSIQSKHINSEQILLVVGDLFLVSIVSFLVGAAIGALSILLMKLSRPVPSA